MSNLAAEQPVMRATIKITRKDTGKVETFELVGHEQKQPEQPEKTDVSDPQRSPA